MLETIGIIVLLVAGVRWLLGKLARWPDAGFRAIAMVIGLFLAVGMTVGGIVMLADPQADIGEGLIFFPWAVAGVVLVVKAAKG